MKKLNCWEFMKCGKGPDNKGEGTPDDICPVASHVLADGLNNGIKGGRLCWIIAEACNHENVKCTDHHNKSSCFSCEFRYKVMMDEGLLNVCNATGAYFQLNRKSREDTESKPSPEEKDSVQSNRS